MRSTPSREQDGAHEELFAAVAQHLAHVCVRLVHASGRTARPYLAQAKSDSSLPASSVSSLLDNSLDGALLLDPATGTIQEINDITCRLVGWHPDAAVGTHYGKLFGPSSQDACEEAFLVALRNGSSHKPGESLCGPSEGRIPVDLHFRMIEHGGRKQMLLIVRDQRERERLQTQMRQAQKLEAIGRLAGGIAHDFNNILTIVSRATDSLEDPTTAEVERTSDLATIRHTIDRATQLTRQLLTFARQQSATPQPIDLRQVISETGRMLSRLVGEGIELDLILCDEESVVYLDRSEFEQLLLNLIVNARDAMEEAGAITIELRRILSANRQAFVELKVSDTGRGIPGDLLPRVFDPFFTTKEDGTGLGLATVYGIVTRAQGSVSVHSEEQAGTIFTVRLPAYEAASSSQSQAKLETIVAQEPSSDATGRILYVEDEENVRSMVARALSRMGHQVTPADNPTLALELFTRGDVAFDLLVTDVLMPGMSGPRMVREMRKLQPDLRVLYVSGYLGEAENLQQIANETHSNYLSKPFRLSDMRRLVAQLLADAFEHRTHAVAETARPTPLSLPTQTEHERSKH